MAEKTQPLIYEKMASIMKAIEPIAKKGTNTIQKYSYRKLDDVYEQLQKLLSKNEVFSVCAEIRNKETREYTTKNNAQMVNVTADFCWRFYAKDGSYVESWHLGEGSDSGDKACNKCMSAAHKYSFMQVFCIPTGEDNDTESEHPVREGASTKVAGNGRCSGKQVALIKKLATEKGYEIEQIEKKYGKLDNLISKKASEIIEGLLNYNPQ